MCDKYDRICRGDGRMCGRYGRMCGRFGCICQRSDRKSGVERTAESGQNRQVPVNSRLHWTCLESLRTFDPFHVFSFPQ